MQHVTKGACAGGFQVLARDCKIYAELGLKLHWSFQPVGGFWAGDLQ